MGMHMSAAGGGVQYVNRGDPGAADYTQATLTCDSAWHDLDLSAIVGARAVLIHLRLVISDATAGLLAKVRMNGQTNDMNAGRANVPSASKPDDEDILVMTDASGVIEYYVDTGMDLVNLTVAGWWE